LKNVKNLSLALSKTFAIKPSLKIPSHLSMLLDYLV